MRRNKKFEISGSYPGESRKKVLDAAVPAMIAHAGRLCRTRHLAVRRECASVLTMGDRKGLDNFGGCALPAALEAMGERWSFLLLRASFSGIVYFEDFQASLGIARNILADRLAKLVNNGILTREPVPTDKRRFAYRLTEKGEGLVPVMIALRQWGERWGSMPPARRVLVDALDRKPVRRIELQAWDGRSLDYRDLCWIEPDAQEESAQSPASAATGTSDTKAVDTAGATC